MTGKVPMYCRAKVANKLLLFVWALVASSSFVTAQQPTPVAKVSLLQKKVSLDFQNTSLEEIFNFLNARYGIGFTYVNNEIPLAQKVTVKVDNKPLGEALDIIFRDLPIVYSEVGNLILLKVKERAPLPPSSPTPKNVSRGNVSDSLSRGKNMEAGKWGRGRKRSFFSLFERKEKGWGVKDYKMPSPADSMTSAADSAGKDTKQPEQKKVVRKPDVILKRWKVGLYYSPNSTFRFLKGDGRSVSERNAAEKKAGGYSIGIGLGYRLSKRVQLKTGLMLMKFAEKGSYSLPLSYLPPPHKRTEGYQTDTTISYANSYQFLSVPLTVGYSVGNEWFLTMNVGLAPVFFLSYNTDYPTKDAATAVYPKDYVPNPEVKTPRPPKQGPAPAPAPKPGGKADVIIDKGYFYMDDLDPRKRKYKTVGMMYALSLEAGYMLKDRFAIVIEPNFNCFIFSIQSGKDNVKERPYSLGVAFSVNYFFR